ncbi:MAG: lysylphosphatidylglycerol synthase transmembrane domain-containing protein [Acidobacteriota bacterium]
MSTLDAPDPASPALPDDSRPDLDHLGRRLLLPAVLGLLALVGLTVFADAKDLAASLKSFDPALLAPVLGLSLVNYVLRFVRWQMYLSALGVSLPLGRSLAVFLVGFVLSVTPGKAGELGKAWLVRQLGGGPARRVVPAVLAERVTDLLGVVLLLAVGALPFPGGRWIALGGVACVLAASGLLTWRRGALAVLHAVGRLPLIRRFVHHFEEMYDLLRTLVSPRLMAAGLALSAVAWGAEAVGFLVVARDYAPQMGLFASLFDYAASTLAGALSMLPGGLLASEGTLAALLGAQGLNAADAASATLIIRVATLWFAVALGLLALPWVLRKVRKKKNQTG